MRSGVSYDRLTSAITPTNGKDIGNHKKSPHSTPLNKLAHPEFLVLPSGWTIICLCDIIITVLF